MSHPRVERALLSVSNKQGLVDFARGLVACGVELYSTGGTKAALEAAGVPVIDVSTYTGFPEMMDGRLKTLHPKVHGGILCRHDHEADRRALSEHGIKTFELVVVNLYPFAETIAKPATTFDQAIEQIDIGGPTMVRAAAKNHVFTTIVTSPLQYAEVLAAIQCAHGTSGDLRRMLAAAAFEHTATYDRTIADWFAGEVQPESAVHPAGQVGSALETVFPSRLMVELQRREILRYGENPHQRAALYASLPVQGPSLVDARKLHGKELSYNNLLDLNAAWTIARSLPEFAVVVIKHNNPCGAASADSLAEATRRAMDGDPVSAFGSVLGFNRPLDAASAEVLVQPGLFVEAIVAPGFSAEALALLTTRPKWRDNVRLLEIAASGVKSALELRALDGGFLAQDPDTGEDSAINWQVVTETLPTPQQHSELAFAWAVVRHVKSNAIVLTRERSLIGAGAGQMSRVDSVEISIRKAGQRAQGAVMASDAFFPFDDSIHAAAAAGVVAVIQPGGSRRDPEVIAACNQHRLPMIFTGRRHFKH